MLPYKLHTAGNVIVVEIIGLGLMEGPELDSMAARLQEELMRSKDKRMVLDCSRLKFMASRALSVIVTLSHMASQHKGGLIACGLQPQLVQVFRISGVERYITLCGTREEAVARLSDPATGPQPGGSTWR
jgi:anti-anti-sigma factor